MLIKANIKKKVIDLLLFGVMTSSDELVSRGKKCSFFDKFGVLCFLVTCFEIHSFAILPTMLSKMMFKIDKSRVKNNIGE